MPMQASTSEKMLNTPPRTLGAKERMKPNTPKMMAMIARTNPEPALTKKLAMAAATAMMDGMLKCGLFCADIVCIIQAPGGG